MTAIDLSEVIDHLVFATPDLDAGIAVIDRKLGVQAVAGGRHPDFGTRNALVALGPETYLEIIGPDPEGTEPDGPRIFGIDELEAPRLATWAAKATDLEDRVATGRAAGAELGEVFPGQRRKPDGTLLTWRLSDPTAMPAHGIVPFLIDWGDTPNPAGDATPGCRLLELRAEHPDPESVRGMLTALQLELPVDGGPSPKLIATIDSPAGTVELW